MPYISKVIITINKPIETVWNTLMDPDSLKYWLTGFVSASHVSGDPDKAGSVSTLTFLEGGKTLVVTETVVTVIPNQQFSFTMTSDPFDNKTDIHLVSVGSQTELTQTVEFFPQQLLMKLMLPFIRGVLKKRMENELLKFKEYIESEK